MKRKMMTRETIPTKATTNGGNGSYMRRALVKDRNTGKKEVDSYVTGVAPAVARYLKR